MPAVRTSVGGPNAIFQCSNISTTFKDQVNFGDFPNSREIYGERNLRTFKDFPRMAWKSLTKN